MSNSRDFSGKVVIITGSTSGIGEGISIYLSKLGANVVVTGRRADEVIRVSKLCESVSPKLLKPLEVVADITNDENVKQLIDATIATFGKLDVLVNNAGAGIMSSIYDNELIEKFENMMKLNVRSVILLSQLSVPHLEKTKGNIINISSIGGLRPNPQLSAYGMSKTALDMFTKCLAIELGPKGIRVNSVNPGPVATNFGIAMGMDVESNKKKFDKLAKASCLGLLGQPQDIAYTVAFLASNDSQFITGTILIDDGGSTLSGLR